MFQLFTQVSLEVGTPHGDLGVHVECEGLVETAPDHSEPRALPDGEQEHVFIWHEGLSGAKPLCVGNSCKPVTAQCRAQPRAEMLEGEKGGQDSCCSDEAPEVAIRATHLLTCALASLTYRFKPPQG